MRCKILSQKKSELANFGYIKKVSWKIPVEKFFEYQKSLMAKNLPKTLCKNLLKIPCDKNLFGSAKNFCEYFNIKILNNTKNFLISPNKTKTFIMYLLKFTIKANGSNCVYYHENLSLNNPKNGAINTYVQHITSERKQALSFFDKEEAERLALFFQYDNYKIIKK